jgi:hypothetical protein
MPGRTIIKGCGEVDLLLTEGLAELMPLPPPPPAPALLLPLPWWFLLK